MIDASINGIECKFYYDERFSQKDAPFDYPYIYQLRHDEDDWSKPVMIERFVLVNFFGTVFMKEPLKLEENDYIDIDTFSMANDMVCFELTTRLLNTTFGLKNES